MLGYLKLTGAAGAFLATAFLSAGSFAGDDLFGAPAVTTDELAVERAQGPDPLAKVTDVEVKDNEVTAYGNYSKNSVSGNAFRNASGVIINVQNNGHANAISVPVGVAVSISP